MPTDDRPAGRGPWCCRLAAVAVLAAAGWAASRNTGDSALRETAPDRVPVEAVVRDRVAYWNEGNLDGFLSYYWTDDELTVYAGGTATTGWQAASDRYRRTYKDGNAEMGRLALSGLEVRYTGPGSAVARGRWELTMLKGSSGGLFTLWLRREVGGRPRAQVDGAAVAAVRRAGGPCLHPEGVGVLSPGQRPGLGAGTLFQPEGLGQRCVPALQAGKPGGGPTQGFALGLRTPTPSG